MSRCCGVAAPWTQREVVHPPCKVVSISGRTLAHGDQVQVQAKGDELKLKFKQRETSLAINL